MNPLRRFVVAPLGKLVYSRGAAVSTAIIGVGSACMWGTSDYFGQQWEIEAQNGWVEEAVAHADTLQRKRSPVGSSESEGGPAAHPLRVNILNPAQIAATALYGGIIFGVGGKLWYPLLDRTLRRALPRASPTNIAMGKLSAEFCIWYPANLMIYWTIMGTLVYQQPMYEIIREGVASHLGATLCAQAPMWIPFQFVNFRFLPAQLNIIAISLFAFAESMAMNWLKAEAMADEEFQLQLTTSKVNDP